MCVPGVEALYACVYALFPLVIEPCYNYQCYFSGRLLVALVPQIFFLFSEARCINSDGWSSMSGFKEECIDGCFFRATYSGKGGAYDLTAHYSPLMRRNDRVESPMLLYTTPSVLKYTREYLSF